MTPNAKIRDTTVNRKIMIEENKPAGTVTQETLFTMKTGHTFDLGTMPESEDTTDLNQNLMEHLISEGMKPSKETETDNLVTIVSKISNKP